MCKLKLILNILNGFAILHSSILSVARFWRPFGWGHQSLKCHWILENGEKNTRLTLQSARACWWPSTVGHLQADWLRSSAPVYLKEICGLCQQNPRMTKYAGSWLFIDRQIEQSFDYHFVCSPFSPLFIISMLPSVGVFIWKSFHRMGRRVLLHVFNCQKSCKWCIGHLRSMAVT